jgi:hypothetical protein
MRNAFGILYFHFVIYLKKKEKENVRDVKFKIFVNLDIKLTK